MARESGFGGPEWFSWRAGGAKRATLFVDRSLGFAWWASSSFGSKPFGKRVLSS
ncbi:MAG: hypothetical protein M3R38_23165 [Actinomycetota bacterium]|nr:hypothetical protein [Actinomycetota bacterium]